MTAGTEESENQSGSGGCWGVCAGRGSARACLQGCSSLGQELRRSWREKEAKGTVFWSVPWQGRAAALMGCCCRFSPPATTNSEGSLHADKASPETYAMSKICCLQLVGWICITDKNEFCLVIHYLGWEP